MKLQKKNTDDNNDLKKSLSTFEIKFNEIGNVLGQLSEFQRSQTSSKPINYPCNILCNTIEQLEEFDSILDTEQNENSVYFVS